MIGESTVNNVASEKDTFLDAKVRAELLSREIDDYVFILSREDDFEVSIISSDIDDRNLLLLFYAGEAIYY
jgi:hypothetical protein